MKRERLDHCVMLRVHDNFRVFLRVRSECHAVGSVMMMHVTCIWDVRLCVVSVAVRMPSPSAEPGGELWVATVARVLLNIQIEHITVGDRVFVRGMWLFCVYLFCICYLVPFVRVRVKSKKWM